MRNIFFIDAALKTLGLYTHIPVVKKMLLKLHLHLPEVHITNDTSNMSEWSNFAHE